MESRWSGTVEDAFFDGEILDKARKIKQPEYEAPTKSSDKSYYILGVDVGRKGCQSVICVFKVVPSTQGLFKYLVNIFTMEDEHFRDQAIKIKKAFFAFRARTVVIDGNGLINQLI